MMKKARALLLCVLILAVGTVVTARAEHYGPLKSSLQPKEVSAGIGYAYEATEWTGPDSKLKFRQNQVVAQWGYGLAHDWELDLRAGLADLTNEDGFVTSENTFNGRFRPQVSFNVGGPVFSGRVLSIGPFFQGTYSYLYVDETYGHATDTTTGALVDTVEKTSVKNIRQATAGLKFQVDMEGANLYFGPSFSVGRAKYRNAFVSATGSDFTQDFIEPERNIAVFTGVRWPLPEGWPTEKSRAYLDLEFRFKDDLSGGTALNFTF